MGMSYQVEVLVVPALAHVVGSGITVDCGIMYVPNGWHGSCDVSTLRDFATVLQRLQEVYYIFFLFYESSKKKF
jgi:hypothetical protein